LYSTTTNQAAIIALFRVINRYVGNLPPMPGVFHRLPGSSDPQHRRGHRNADDAVGHSASAENARPRNQHPQHAVAALAWPAEAGEPLPSPG
jgi:hypothetical protein